ncbi:type II secretion system GspH family protein [Patescibacteria group bacterium]|nr:type II secretion system GspH family protein [Patescibacteria group bacterium]
MLKLKKNRGFTLIELLIVLVIISITIGILVITNIQTQMQKSRDLQRKADLTKIKTALEMYKTDNNTYPVAGSWRGACGDNGGSYDLSGPNGYIPNLSPQYIEELPKDPRSGQTNPLTVSICGTSWKSCYLYLSNGQNYKLLAHCSPEAPGALNNPNDLFYDPVRPQHAWQISTGSFLRSN